MVASNQEHVSIIGELSRTVMQTIRQTTQSVPAAQLVIYGGSRAMVQCDAGGENHGRGDVW